MFDEHTGALTDAAPTVEAAVATAALGARHATKVLGR